MNEAREVTLMILGESEHVHSTVRRSDGVRTLRTWGPGKTDHSGRPILSEPGDGSRKYDRKKTAPGYVLYTPGHSNKFPLIDVEGRIVHEWPAWTSHFGYLLPNGHLLLDAEFAPDRGPGVVELDWNGEEKWFCPCPIHHDFQRLDNGNTMLLCHREIVCPKIGPGRLLEVAREGEIVWEFQNPHAAYAEGERKVYRAYKYPPEIIEPLL